MMQGGGVLGVALVGYTHAMEQAGLRFRSIAGTSAGAINALLVAALVPPAEPKSEKLLRDPARMEIDEFLDGECASVALSRALAGGSTNWFRLGWILLRVHPTLRDHLGLHPG